VFRLPLLAQQLKLSRHMVPFAALPQANASLGSLRPEHLLPPCAVGAAEGRDSGEADQPRDGSESDEDDEDDDCGGPTKAEGPPLELSSFAEEDGAGDVCVNPLVCS
jgi:hypothetical protein